MAKCIYQFSAFRDILDLEDKTIKSENTNDNPKRIEIVEEDITKEDEGIWAEEKTSSKNSLEY